MAPVWTAAQAPVAVAQNVPGIPVAPSPALAFANGLAAYLRASKHRADPLIAEGGTPADPARQLIEGAGARKGMVGTAVKLGQSVYHIYFHPDGRREVIKVAGPGIHGVGVSHGGALVGGLARGVVHPGTLVGALAAQRTGGMLAP